MSNNVQGILSAKSPSELIDLANEKPHGSTQRTNSSREAWADEARERPHRAGKELGGCLAVFLGFLTRRFLIPTLCPEDTPRIIRRKAVLLVSCIGGSAPMLAWVGLLAALPDLMSGLRLFVLVSGFVICLLLATSSIIYIYRTKSTWWVEVSMPIAYTIGVVTLDFACLGWVDFTGWSAVGLVLYVVAEGGRTGTILYITFGTLFLTLNSIRWGIWGDSFLTPINSPPWLDAVASASTRSVPFLLLGIGILVFTRILEVQEDILIEAMQTIKRKQKRQQHDHLMIQHLVDNVLPSDVAKPLAQHIQGVMDSIEQNGDEQSHSSVSASEFLAMRPPDVAVQYEEAAVLFMDVVGFTTASSKMSAQTLVKDLGVFIGHLDSIVMRGSGVEKVKTIGDCYMAVAVPERMNTDAVEACRTLLTFASEAHKIVSSCSLGGHTIAMRGGMDCGPAVSGVIGTLKFVWDFWGDTVNIASRMESTGVARHTQVTERCKDHLLGSGEGPRPFLKPRGRMEVKGKGEMLTFLHIPDSPDMDLVQSS